MNRNHQNGEKMSCQRWKFSANVVHVHNMQNKTISMRILSVDTLFWNHFIDFYLFFIFHIRFVKCVVLDFMCYEYLDISYIYAIWIWKTHTPNISKPKLLLLFRWKIHTSIGTYLCYKTEQNRSKEKNMNENYVLDAYLLSSNSYSINIFTMFLHILCFWIAIMGLTLRTKNFYDIFGLCHLCWFIVDIFAAYQIFTLWILSLLSFKNKERASR